MREWGNRTVRGPGPGSDGVSAAMICHDDEPHSCVSPRWGQDHLVARLLMVVSGHMELTAGGQQVGLEPGFGMYVERDTPCSYVTRGEVAYVLAELRADPKAFQDVLIEPYVPMRIPALISATSALVRAASPGADAQSAASKRNRVLAHIAAHHSETGLNVASLAADLGLSTRSLQRLFADQDKGVAEEIADARLDHALRLLRDPLLAGLTLAEIAARSGFGSVARMRRKIRIATGKNPQECRALYRSGGERELGRRDHTTLRAQAPGVGYSIAV